MWFDDPVPPRLGWSLDMRGRAHPVSRGLLLLLTLAALVFHVCAPDAAPQEPAARVVWATPPGTDSGQGLDVHAVSCDAIKPGMLGSSPVAVSNEPIPDTSIVESAARPTMGSTPVLVSRPPLFLLHASLLI
jgi:hypothetical protein